MTDFPASGTFEALNDLQTYCHGSARERGFHEAGDALNAAREAFPSPHHSPLARVLDASYIERIGNRLMLIVGEVTEAHEEIRSGRPVNETYYSDGGKPEGVPSELADILIRVMDFAGEYDIDLAAIVQEKLEFNAKRARLHGKKF